MRPAWLMECGWMWCVHNPGLGSNPLCNVPLSLSLLVGQLHVQDQGGFQWGPSRQQSCCLKEPWTWSCHLEKCCPRVSPQPNAWGLIPWVSRVHSSSSRASPILIRTPKQSFWNNFILRVCYLGLKEKDQTTLNCPFLMGKVRTLLDFLVLFCNLVFWKSQVAHGKDCNEISILRIYEALKPVSLSWPLGHSQLHSETRQLMGSYRVYWPLPKYVLYSHHCLLLFWNSFFLEYLPNHFLQDQLNSVSCKRSF